MITHTLGFPRIGLKRELKKATERFWRGKADQVELDAIGEDLRKRHWQLQLEAGIDLIPAGDFSFYDHMLDMIATVGAVPDRYNWSADEVDVTTYFRMARGDRTNADMPAMEMTKWFDTNYHYIVPEFWDGQSFRVASSRLFDQVEEARSVSAHVKAVIPGPFTFLHLGKSVDDGFDRWSLLDNLIDVYADVLRRLFGKVSWVQLDEPILVLDLPSEALDRMPAAYARLREAAGDTRLMLATYFGSLGDNMPAAVSLPVDALHVDLVRGQGQADQLVKAIPDSLSLSLGLIDGRNIWRTDLERASQVVSQVVQTVGSQRVLLAPSCSLLHVPIDLEAEMKLDPEIRSWMAFGRQKCREARTLADAAAGRDATQALEENRNALASRRKSPRVHNPVVADRIAAVTEVMARRQAPFSERQAVQHKRLDLPTYPTTTIGSYPQTSDIRKLRRQLKKGELSEAAYNDSLRDIIADTVKRQEKMGLDVLVHGEPERNDMVEYFGEQLDGYCFTSHGWVQSYGSRYVKPPVIYGDINRPKAMTVEWISYAQSLTSKPMKGMLTGPVTMLCWSFVRDDQPRSETCRQLALAIREEVNDLEAAGIRVIQIDEPALREGLPLRKAEWNQYLSWATESFRLATSGVSNETQIHTHMCYSEFNEIVEWIARLDADVISVEASRSRMELLDVFHEFRYPNEIGPGVYDVHSPRVPSAEEMLELLKKAAEVIPAEQLWVNPDCGLKTRGWAEVEPSISNMVKAAKAIRDE